jgi:hypothetical protein
MGSGKMEACSLFDVEFRMLEAKRVESPEVHPTVRNLGSCHRSVLKLPGLGPQSERHVPVLTFPRHPRTNFVGPSGRCNDRREWKNGTWCTIWNWDASYCPANWLLGYCEAFIFLDLLATPHCVADCCVVALGRLHNAGLSPPLWCDVM